MDRTCWLERGSLFVHSSSRRRPSAWPREHDRYISPPRVAVTQVWRRDVFWPVSIHSLSTVTPWEGAARAVRAGLAVCFACGAGLDGGAVLSRDQPGLA